MFWSKGNLANRPYGYSSQKNIEGGEKYLFPEEFMQVFQAQKSSCYHQDHVNTSAMVVT